MFLTKLPIKKQIATLILKCQQSTSPQNVLEELNQRTLIQISGTEVTEFLQGLITNDIHHLSETVGSMYTMFLNTKGRVLYDSIIYKTSKSHSYLIECDKDASSALEKHLKMYRVRRKIDITNIEDIFKVYVLFNPVSVENIQNTEIVNNIQGKIVPCTTLNDNRIEISKEIGVDELLVYRDPRLRELGSRVLAPSDLDFKSIKAGLNLIENSCNDIKYKTHRYKLGVGEGTENLPPGNCFPLEANCDYLHGVSFHKGCYIGQEVTARTHHTGVVRKRLMPIYLKASLNINKVPEEEIKSMDEAKRNLGKLRGVSDTFGLGLLRITEALQAKRFLVGDVEGSTLKPSWWPVVAPKEVAVERS